MLFTSINLLIFYNPPCYLHIISKNYIFISLFQKLLHSLFFTNILYSLLICTIKIYLTNLFQQILVISLTGNSLILHLYRKESSY